MLSDVHPEHDTLLYVIFTMFSSDCICVCKYLYFVYLCNRDNKIDECGLDLCFATDFEILGKLTQHELKPGGTQIPVTDENKEEYLK